MDKVPQLSKHQLQRVRGQRYHWPATLPWWGALHVAVLPSSDCARHTP